MNLTSPPNPALPCRRAVQRPRPCTTDEPARRGAQRPVPTPKGMDARSHPQGGSNPALEPPLPLQLSLIQLGGGGEGVTVPDHSTAGASCCVRYCVSSCACSLQPNPRRNLASQNPRCAVPHTFCHTFRHTFRPAGGAGVDGSAREQLPAASLLGGPQGARGWGQGRRWRQQRCGGSVHQHADQPRDCEPAPAAEGWHSGWVMWGRGWTLVEVCGEERGRWRLG